MPSLLAVYLLLMSKNTDPLLGNPYTVRSPEMFAACEVLWAGLGDLVHESDGNHKSVLDYFKIGNSVTSFPGDTEGERLLRHEQSRLAAWSVPETSNGVVLGYTRRYALRFEEELSRFHRLTAKEVNVDRTVTELLIGRWAVNCTKLENLADEDTKIRECEPPAFEEIIEDVDLNAVLKYNDERFEKKKADYQKFRDRARELQTIDLRDKAQLTTNFLGDIEYDGQSISDIADKIRSSADSANNYRLTLYEAVTLWRLAQQDEA